MVNKNRTDCYDPYIEIHLDIGDPVMFLVLIPSVLMAVLTILTMIVFLTKRETPIVKQAIRTMTSIQLCSHLLLFLFPVLSVFVSLSPTTCIFDQVFLGMAFSLTLSINISKSQKLYMIVTSKLRMSNTEILMTKASEWLIILAALLINALLHLFFFINGTVTVQQKYFDQTLTKEFYCSNEIMIFVQLFVAAILSLCNGIQGFLAIRVISHRNLW